jgi:hypothetical protein
MNGRAFPFFVIPAKAGTQERPAQPSRNLALGSRFRGNDEGVDIGQ